MQNVIFNENASHKIMDDNVVTYYPEVKQPRKSSASVEAHATCHRMLVKHNSNLIIAGNTNCHNTNFKSRTASQKYSHLLIRAITAAATVATSVAVAAATTTTTTSASSTVSSPTFPSATDNLSGMSSMLAQERLKFVYENSIATQTLDESIINNTLIFGSSYMGSLSSAATSYTLLNDSWVNGSSALFTSSSASPSPTSIIEGVNFTSTAGSDDWSHFNDLILSWQGVCLIAVFCVLIVITIIGNTLVIMAVITTRRLKTVTNCFVMSLAVADFLVGIFVMPPAVAVHLIGSWKLGWILCDIWISLDVLLCTASILSLCAISVDRYLAVTRPLTYSRKRRSKRLALIMILIVWVLALAITCPPILGWYEPGRRDLNECRYNQNEGYVIFSAMGSFFIPMAVMIYVYARISCVVAARHDNMTDISIHNIKKFKRYTSADVDNELDPDISELDLSSGQRKQQAARTLSNQTLAKELHEIMAAENEVPTNATQCHSLLATPGTIVSPVSNAKNGCYELTRATSLRRTPTASSNMTIMTTTTGTGTATASTNAENPWTFSAINTPSTTISSTNISSHHHHHHHGSSHYQQHSHPNKNMRTHSVRHQHYMSAPPATLMAVTADALTPGNSVATSILRQHSSQPTTHSTPMAGQSTRITQHHGHGSAHHYGKSSSNRITSLKKENKTTQTLSIVVGGFIACWLPFFVYYLITPFLEEHQVSRTLAKGLTWLGWCNSAINPFIYAFYSVDFRAAFWRLTCKRFFSASSKPQFQTNTMSIRR